MNRAGLGVLIGGSAYLRASTREQVFALDLLDLERLALRTIDLGFLAHGFCTKPGHETTAALFEKRGPHAAVVELLTGDVRTIDAGPGHAFYGHGAFSPDADELFGVEIDTRTHEGVLRVRDAETWEVTGEIPTGGKNPHDARILDERTLVVTNGGGEIGTPAAASVAFIDLRSRRVTERVFLSDPALNAGHVAIAKDGSIAVVSAPRDGLPAGSVGGLSLRSAGETGSLQRMREPADLMTRLVGESLSVAVHEATGVVAATHPFAHRMSLWSLAEKRLLRAFELESARGVTLTPGGALFAVTHGNQGSLSLLDPTTLDFVVGQTMEIGRFTGSHTYAWTLPAGAAFATEPA